MSGWDSVKLGARATMTKVILNEDVERFADIVGDYNPIHFDELYASTTRFKGRIVHGILSVGLISAVIGSQLPGPGSIYLSQTVRFRKPVHIGDAITAVVEVVSVQTDKPIVTLATHCKNQLDEIVLDGEAIVMLTN